MKRINPDPTITLDALGMKTSLLARAVIHAVVLEPDHRVQFYTAAGEGAVIVQRVRMEISRLRNGMKERGKQPAAFRLPTRIYPETIGGIRYDSVVMEKVASRKQLMAESMRELDELFKGIIKS